MIADYHVHLRDERGGIDHSLAAVERFCARAAGCGIGEIGFVEHVYYFAETRALWTLPYQTERCVYPLDDYVDAIVEAQRRGLPVKLGLEVDWTPPENDELALVLEPYPWDFRLGSVHWLDGLEVTSAAGAWDGRRDAEIWRRYARELAAAARSGHFDVLSHPDRPKHWGGEPPAELYTELEEAARAGGVALELSAGDLGAAGSPLLDTAAPVTLASDAHEPARLGAGLARVAGLLRERGRETYAAFDGRVRREELLA